MKKLIVVLVACFVSVFFILAPLILDAHGGFGGGFHGGGFHGGGSHGGGFQGGGFGGHPGGFHGGSYGGFHGYPSHHGGHFGYGPFFGFGVGLYGGYWSDGYYYTYPYYGVCQRWVPTGSYHTEMRQDPYTGNLYQVQVPDGYWEAVPCY